MVMYISCVLLSVIIVILTSIFYEIKKIRAHLEREK